MAVVVVRMLVVVVTIPKKAHVPQACTVQNCGNLTVFLRWSQSLYGMQDTSYPPNPATIAQASTVAASLRKLARSARSSI